MDQSNQNLATSSFAHREKTFQELKEFEHRFRRIAGLRPMALAALGVRAFAPAERRRIIQTSAGINLYLDPLSNLGRTILATGAYEPENAAVFEQEIKPGNTVLDIGANEGYFSVLAGRLVGPEGTILCVEPQSRLTAVIEINLAINQISRSHVFQCAVGEDAGSMLRLNLYPDINTGASSFMRKYGFSRKHEHVPFASLESILQSASVDKVDFVKVDVEGYEFKVIPALLPLIRSGKVGRLFVDYHEPILAKNGIDPRNLHDQLIAAGMQPSVTAACLTSYVLYRPAGFSATSA